MSHNLVLEGFDLPFQTPTFVTRAILEQARNDLHALDLYEDWVHLTFDPPVLRGKDATNPWMIEQRNRAIQEIADAVTNCRSYVRSKNLGRRLITTN